MWKIDSTGAIGSSAAALEAVANGCATTRISDQASARAERSRGGAVGIART
jgi:hypothetical protein